MEFKAKIYIPNTKLNFFQKWALTEQLFFLSFVVLIFMVIIDNLFRFDRNLNDYILVKILYFLCIIPWFLNVTYRLREFERINGELKGEISFKENGIQINETLFLFTEIKNLDISYGNKYNEHTGNIRIGPYLSLGLNNHISFYHNGKLVKTYFQLFSTAQYDAIQADLFYYVINEIFPFEIKNLSFIHKQFHNYTLYKEFIEKMKREGKLS